MSSALHAKPLVQPIWKLAAILAGLLISIAAVAQQPCPSGVRVEGTITDPTGAAISGASVRTADGETAKTDAAGQFNMACVPAASVTVTAEAEGFASNTATPEIESGGIAEVKLQLAIAQTHTDVQVNEDVTAIDADHGGDTTLLTGKDVQQLADDPDDLLRELQVLAASAGGDPTTTILSVDGFQNAGALPPKSSIASIRVNPDLFSSEYPWPPFGGGLIEIFTKPGADSFHGALFFTDSNSVFNATDPFSITATPASKQRYGFELSGPLVPKKSGFSLTLEKRDIDEFNVVNAITLDADGNETPLQQSVAAPQRLWIASARADWQVAPKDVATLSYSANVNNLGNQGVGGLTLAQAGYASLIGEYDLRLTNMLTLSPNLLHETRVGYTWKRTQQTPLSTSPALSVAGYFNGGGATSQNLNDRECDLEVDDDLMTTRGKHTLKFGTQSLGIFVHDYDPDTFNGAYVFGGGSAPALDANDNPTGQTTTITAIEQYSRALQNLPGGSPTTYQVTTGTPLVPFTQWRLALYAQDTVKLAPRLTLDAGLRYSFQTTPGTFANFAPRAGFAWAVDKKETWVFHLRTGIFNNSSISPSWVAEVDRLNGARQHESTVFSPNYNDPLAPAPGAIDVSTVKQFATTLAPQSTFVAYFNAEHDFPHHWHARGNLFWGEDWNSIRLRNINAPLVASSIGIAPDPTTALLAPRPIAPNENILQYQNTGHLAGNVISFTIDQHSYKRFGLSARYAHMNFKCDVPNDLSRQSSYSEEGESSRVDWLRHNSGSLVGNLILPYKVEVATQFDAGQGRPYNITTGTDNNGDGDFDDRPSYASAPGAGVYSTPFGLLTTNTVNGNAPRNLGTMPGTIHLDMNLSRVFQLSAKNSDHPRTLTFNARSANLLNHTNVTTVGTVVSSPTLGQSLAAEAARRVEIGVRFAF
jgi:Carboxypeptidase regulatory-like domain/TonB dependent receptor